MVNPLFLSQSQTRAQVIGGGWIWSPTAKLTNQFRVGYNRFWQQVVQADHNSDPASAYGLNTGVTDPTNFGMPEIRIGGFVQHTLGGNQSWPLYTTPNQTLQFTDSATYVIGKHNLKFGGEFRTGSTDNLRNTFGSGEIRFSDLEEFTTGDVRSSGGNFVFVGNSRRIVSQKSFGGFIQDNWRVTPRLTIDAGLRYDAQLCRFMNKTTCSPISIRRLDCSGRPRNQPALPHRLQQFRSALGDRLGPERRRQNSISRGRRGDLRDSAYLGLYWPEQYQCHRHRPESNWSCRELRWVGRGDDCSGDARARSRRDERQLEERRARVWRSFARQPLVQQRRALPSVRALQESFDSLRDELERQRATGSVEKRRSDRGLRRKQGHAGSTTFATSIRIFTRMTGSNDETDEQTGRPFYTTFPTLSNIYQLANGADSIYHGLQVTLRQNSNKGLYFVAGYTWAHAIDTSGSNRQFNIQNSYDPAFERSNSDSDIRNRFTFAMTYELPSKHGFAQMLQGWHVNGIFTAQGGTPLFIYDSFNDISGTGEFNDHWNITGDPGQPALVEEYSDSVSRCRSVQHRRVRSRSTSCSTPQADSIRQPSAASTRRFAWEDRPEQTS